MRLFTSPNGRIGSLPWSREHAVTEGFGRYNDMAGPCPVCGSMRLAQAIRYTADGSCFHCQWEAFEAIAWAWSVGVEPVPPHEDHEHFAHTCNNGPHIQLLSKRTGKCVECERQSKPNRDATAAFVAASPDAVISRDLAAEAGLKLYRTGEPCKHGHVTWRYTSTGGCVECLSRGASDRLPKPVDPPPHTRIAPERVAELIAMRKRAVSAANAQHLAGIINDANKPDSEPDGGY